MHRVLSTRDGRGQPCRGGLSNPTHAPFAALLQKNEKRGGRNMCAYNAPCCATGARRQSQESGEKELCVDLRRPRALFSSSFTRVCLGQRACRPSCSGPFFPLCCKGQGERRKTAGGIRRFVCLRFPSFSLLCPSLLENTRMITAKRRLSVRSRSYITVPIPQRPSGRERPRAHQSSVGHSTAARPSRHTHPLPVRCNHAGRNGGSVYKAPVSSARFASRRKKKKKKRRKNTPVATLSFFSLLSSSSLEPAALPPRIPAASWPQSKLRAPLPSSPARPFIARPLCRLFHLISSSLVSPLFSSLSSLSLPPSPPSSPLSPARSLAQRCGSRRLAFSSGCARPRSAAWLGLSFSCSSSPSFSPPWPQRRPPQTASTSPIPQSTATRSPRGRITSSLCTCGQRRGRCAPWRRQAPAASHSACRRQQSRDAKRLPAARGRV